jgi:hypothetical protein
MVDLVAAHGPITAGDFIFKVGRNNSPSTWVTATGPGLHPALENSSFEKVANQLYVPRYSEGAVCDG